MRSVLTESPTPASTPRAARHAPFAPGIDDLPRVRLLVLRGVAVASLALLCASAGADADDHDDQRNNGSQLRSFIGQQVGGIDKLMVPATNAAIPVPMPRQTGMPIHTAERYKTTEAKRYLGKLLFHDPVRTARVNSNEGQPVDLPAGTAFGGTLSASNPSVAAIVAATKQTGSCGSCHFGEAATKAGAQINLHVGAEGRGYTDANGKFVVRRRTQDILVQKRSTPLFPGDTLVDALPTLTDIDIIKGQRVVTTPAPFYHPESGAEKLLMTGRLDELDSVARVSMSVIGFAFNNRLLFGGFGGELQELPAALNPLNDPAGENMTLLLLDAHRMLNSQSAELVKIPTFVKLFREAFPEEAAVADRTGNLGELINDQTVFRATATFLRTVVTRNTPFDRFLAGDDHALTASQRRGAKLFFTPAANGQGGAGCVSCHSGPMLNKQVNDPDVAGIGNFVEENFINVGRGDHPVQALNAEARGRLDRYTLGKDGFPYHLEDTGRQEITGNPNHAFKFRSLTLRQLKDAGNFFHDGAISNLREVVEYFNAGVPQDGNTERAGTLDPRFTDPRGPGNGGGLGMSKRQVDDLTNFLENGLYDPALVKYDPKSSTDAFQPHERDLTYSKYRPDLAALGAKDGFMLSGLAINNNDPLSRRDQGLEFLDVTGQAYVSLDRSESDTRGRRQSHTIKITNNSTKAIDTHLLVVARGLARDTKLENASGTTKTGDPYLRVFLPEGALRPGKTIELSLNFWLDREAPHHGQPKAPQVRYTLGLLSGQGNP
jgi:cytochrome c peroxidase